MSNVFKVKNLLVDEGASAGNLSATGDIIVNGNINNDGNVVVIEDDAQFNGIENTMPNQTLAGGGSSVITQDLLLRQEINYGWTQGMFTGSGESVSTATMTQTNYFVGGVLTFTVAALSAYSQWLTLNTNLINYPFGSGRAAQFGNPFTMFFELDTNLDSSSGTQKSDYSVDWIYGVSSPATYPTSSDKCLVVRNRYNPDVVSTNDGSRTIEAAIHTGTSIVTSGAMSLSIGNSSLKQKLCIVWDGSTLYAYLADWTDTTYSSSTTFTLVASATASVSGSMSYWNAFIASRAYQNFSGTVGPAIHIQAPKFIRQAIHPIT